MLNIGDYIIHFHYMRWKSLTFWEKIKCDTYKKQNTQTLPEVSFSPKPSTNVQGVKG